MLTTVVVAGLNVVYTDVTTTGFVEVQVDGLRVVVVTVDTTGLVEVCMMVE